MRALASRLHRGDVMKHCHATLFGFSLLLSGCGLDALTSLFADHAGVCDGEASSSDAWDEKYEACRTFCADDGYDVERCRRADEMFLNDDPTTEYHPPLEPLQLELAYDRFAERCEEHDDWESCAREAELANALTRMFTEGVGELRTSSKVEKNTIKRAAKLAKKACKKGADLGCAVLAHMALNSLADDEGKDDDELREEIAELNDGDGSYNLATYAGRILRVDKQPRDERDTDGLASLCKGEGLYRSDACSFAGIFERNNAQKARFYERACEDHVFPSKFACAELYELDLSSEWEDRRCAIEKAEGGPIFGCPD